MSQPDNINIMICEVNSLNFTTHEFNNKVRTKWALSSLSYFVAPVQLLIKLQFFLLFVHCGACVVHKFTSYHLHSPVVILLKVVKGLI